MLRQTARAETPNQPMIDYAQLENRLSDCEIGHTVYTYPECPSTQDIAHTLAATHRSGTLVLAEQQTAGRGRQGRTWTDRRGLSLAASLLLKPPIGIGAPASTALTAGLVVWETVSALLPALREELWLKWPNDVVWRREDGSLQKLAGILFELHSLGAAPSHGVLGIGINVNHAAADLPPVTPGASAPTSLHLLAGRPQDRRELLVALCRRLARRLHPRRLRQPAARPWEEKLATLGQHVVVQTSAAATQSLTGIATGTTAAGHLIVEDAAGRRHEVTASDVSIRMVRKADAYT